VHASVTVTTGSNEDLPGLARLVGETMVDWLREIEGFEGLLMLTREETGTTHVVSLWENREIAERHREARYRFRDSITATVNVRVDEVLEFDVPYAWRKG
jgi:hypothetical protein